MYGVVTVLCRPQGVPLSVVCAAVCGNKLKREPNTRAPTNTKTQKTTRLGVSTVVCRTAGRPAPHATHVCACACAGMSYPISAEAPTILEADDSLADGLARSMALASHEDRLRAAQAIERLGGEALAQLAPAIGLLMHDDDFLVRRAALVAHRNLPEYARVVLNDDEAAVKQRQLKELNEEHLGDCTSEFDREEQSHERDELSPFMARATIKGYVEEEDEAETSDSNVGQGVLKVSSPSLASATAPLATKAPPSTPPGTKALSRAKAASPRAAVAAAAPVMRTKRTAADPSLKQTIPGNSTILEQGDHLMMAKVSRQAAKGQGRASVPVPAVSLKEVKGPSSALRNVRLMGKASSQVTTPRNEKKSPHQPKSTSTPRAHQMRSSESDNTPRKATRRTSLQSARPRALGDECYELPSTDAIEPKKLPQESNLQISVPSERVGSSAGIDSVTSTTRGESDGVVALTVATDEESKDVSNVNGFDFWGTMTSLTARILEPLSSTAPASVDSVESVAAPSPFAYVQVSQSTSPRKDKQHTNDKSVEPRTDAIEHCDDVDSVREPHAAICFAAGYCDLISAVALACVNKSTARVVPLWLRSLKAVRVSADVPTAKLCDTARIATRMVHLQYLYVAGFKLDVRWLRSKIGAPALDLTSLTGAPQMSPHAAYTLSLLACRLAQSSALRRVSLNGCAIELQTRKLDLKAKELGDTCTGAIAGVLAGARMPNLRELLLPQNRLTAAGVAPLSEAIASGALSGLKTLALGENRLGASGAAILASAMHGPEDPGCASLMTLNVEGNQLGDKGIAAFAEPIAAGALPSLEVLNLSRNDVSDPTPLSDAIAAGEVPYLRRLLLQHNRLAEDKVRSLHDTIGASKPKPTPPSSRSASAQTPTGVGVRTRSLFTPTNAPSPHFVPSHKRGFPLKRDVAAQTTSTISSTVGMKMPPRPSRGDTSK